MNHSRSLRVAWLLPTAWFYWQPAISELTQRIPQTKIFTGLWPGFSQGLEGTLQFEVVGDRKVIAVSKSKESYGDNFTYLSPKIIPRLFKFKPHIIFTSSFGIWTILALLFKILGGWKVVIAYEGSSPGVDYRNSPLRLWIRRIMVRVADACITNSHGGKRYLVEILNASPKRVTVQPYEVPDERSLQTELSTQRMDLPPAFHQLHHPIFLFVGSIGSRKDPQCLLEACKHLKAESDAPFSVVFVGEGEDRSALEALTKDYNLQACVLWTGRVNYDAIGAYFEQSDVFVLPTLEDTWGVVTLEAMLLGKAILCSTGAGTAELIEEGKNGYCFSPGDVQGLAAKMKIFIDNPALSQTMGECSRVMMSQYTPKAGAEMMFQVIQQVIKQ